MSLQANHISQITSSFQLFFCYIRTKEKWSILCLIRRQLTAAYVYLSVPLKRLNKNLLQMHLSSVANCWCSLPLSLFLSPRLRRRHSSVATVHYGLIRLIEAQGWPFQWLLIIWGLCRSERLLTHLTQSLTFASDDPEADRGGYYRSKSNIRQTSNNTEGRSNGWI